MKQAAHLTEIAGDAADLHPLDALQMAARAGLSGYLHLSGGAAGRAALRLRAGRIVALEDVSSGRTWERAADAFELDLVAINLARVVCASRFLVMRAVPAGEVVAGELDLDFDSAVRLSLEYLAR